jgi:hypothetical protein
MRSFRVAELARPVRVAAGFDDATRSEDIVKSVRGVCSEGAAERPEIGRNDVAILRGFAAALEGPIPLEIEQPADNGRPA